MTTKSKKYNYNINALGNLSINNLNLGVSNIFSGSFSASNNVSSASNVTGLSFDNSQTTSFQCQITVIITRTIGSDLSETFTLEGQQNSSGWGLYTSSLGDITGVNFSITNLGQIQYTSSNITNFSSSIFRYNVNQISKTGTYTNFNIGTQGTYLVNSLQITNTVGSIFNVSPGAFHVLGGSTFEKSITIKTTENSIDFTNGGSLTTYGGASFAKNLLVGGNIGIGVINPDYTLDINGNARISNLITSTNITATNSTISNSNITNLITTNSSISSLITTNSSVSNLIVTNSSVSNINVVNSNVTNGTISNIVVTSYSGSNLRLSGDLFVGGTITTVNITTTNISETNVSAGTVTAINSNITNQTIGTSIITGNIGIGISSPANRLHLYTPNTSGNIGTIFQNGSRQYTIGIRGDTNNSFAIQDDSASAFRMVINTAGNMGVGITIPEYRLDVGGSFRATSGDVTLGTLVVTNSNLTTQTVGTSRITNNLLAIGNSNTVGNIFTTGGNVGIGVTNPVTWSQLHLKTPSSISGAFLYLDASTSASGKNYAIGSSLSGNISGAGNLEFFDATSDTTRMVIGSTGNIGISNNTPVYTLDINGSFEVSTTSGNCIINTQTSGNVEQQINLTSGTTGNTDTTRFFQRAADKTFGIFNVTAGRTQFRLETFTSGSDRLSLLENRGFVGIGTRFPEAPLHIIGSSSNLSSTVGGIMMGTDSNNYARIEMVSTRGSYINFTTTGTDASGRIIYDIPSHYFEMNTNGVSRLRLDSIGNMVLTGDLTVFGSISDMRWKKDITLLDINGMSVIHNLRPVTFTWKDDVGNILKRGKRDVGFIAQEVEKVIDYVVDEYTDINNNQVYKKINHERLIPYLTLSLQQLDKKVVKQQEEIEMLKTELQSNKQEFETRLSELLNKISNLELICNCKM